MTLVQYFHSATLFDLILTLTFAKYKAYTKMVPYSFFVRHFGKVWQSFPAQQPISSKSDDVNI